MLRIDFLFDKQVATHLKGLDEKAKLNEKHVKIVRIYKAKAPSLTSERTELQERAQHMTEEVERLKSRAGNLSPARWASPTNPKLRSGWSLILLARKNRAKFGPARLTRGPNRIRSG